MEKTCSAVIVAAGSAQRMRGIDKMRATLCGKTLLEHSVHALAVCEQIAQIVLVTREDLLAEAERLQAEEPKLTKVVLGGDSRAVSVLRGLSEIATPLVAVHDGARPLVTPQIVAQAVQAAAHYGAAAPAVAVRDTIKVVRAGLVERTPDRSTLFAVQTPQVFDTELLRAALRAALAQGLPLTDDCSAVEAAGACVHLTQGSEENLKVTFPSDLALAETILTGRLHDANRTRL